LSIYDIVAGRGTDELRFDLPQGQRSLFRNERPAVRPSQPPSQSIPVGLKRPVREAKQLLVSSVDVKN